MKVVSMCAFKQKKGIVFVRNINNLFHRFCIVKECRLHCEIIETLYERCVRRNIPIDIDDLFGQVMQTI